MIATNTTNLFHSIEIANLFTSINVNARSSSSSKKWKPKIRKLFSSDFHVDANNSLTCDLYLTINFYCFRSMLKTIYGIEKPSRLFSPNSWTRIGEGWLRRFANETCKKLIITSIDESIDDLLNSRSCFWLRVLLFSVQKNSKWS